MNDSLASKNWTNGHETTISLRLLKSSIQKQKTKMAMKLWYDNAKMETIESGAEWGSSALVFCINRQKATDATNATYTHSHRFRIQTKPLLRHIKFNSHQT